jgi:hypothetical protein
MFSNRKSIYLGCLFLGAAFFIVSCSQNKIANKEPDDNGTERKKDVPLSKLEVSPAFKDFNLAYQKFAVNPAKAQELSIDKTGTVIEIPANAFVDEKGNVITEKVDINFREFHDAAEIIASGIPMHNPETGQYMETAGMFEIKGLCKGKEIFIAPNKKINVKLASYNEGNQFDFFKLDENGRWDTKQKNGDPQINLRRANKLNSIESSLPEKPVKPQRFSKNSKFVFDLNVDYKKLPELSIFKDVIWQYAGKPKDADNPENNPEVFETTWTSINVERKKDNYILLLDDGKKKFEMRVVPVLKGTEYEKARADFDSKMTNYQKAKEELAEIEKMYQDQAAIQRSFQIDGFGIYNWDKWKDDATKRLQVKVDFDKEFDYAENMPNVTFFLVNNDRKAVVKFSLREMSNFVYPIEEENSLIAVLPGNRVAKFSKEDFEKLNKSNPRNGEEVTIKMKTLNKKINSVEDISEALAMN